MNFKDRVRSMNFKNRHKFDSDIRIDSTEFYAWYMDKKKICSYCKIPESLLAKIDTLCKKSKQIIRFTIDRMNNNMPYSMDNICLSCNRCNIAKGGTFTYDEFVEIAEKYIMPKWIKNN